MIKYIVLDVDRTLVDSFEPELLSFQEAIENVTCYRINDEQARNFTVMPTTKFLKSLNLRAVPFATIAPRVTCPSEAITTSPSRLTHKIVVLRTLFSSVI